MIEMPETRYVKTADGTRLAYQVFGSGKRDILYLPGHIGHVEVHWEDPLYAAFLRGLGSFARVIAVDRRGQGLSDRLSPGDLPPPEVLVDDVVSVMAEIRSHDTVVLGHDEGAQIGVLLAASHPDAVRGLILYGSSPSGAWSPATPWGDTEEEWMSWLAWVIPRWGSMESAIVDVQEAAPERVGDEAFTRWVAKLYRYGVSPNAASALYQLALGLDVTDVLPAVRVPTMVAHRTGDRMTPMEAGRFMAARIPEARFVELPGEDHFPNGPSWEALVDTIRGFVDGSQDRPTDSRRLATVLFTDVVGSTARSAELGDAAWKVMLESHHSAVRRELELHGGHELSTAGDGFFATSGDLRRLRSALARSPTP